MSYIFYFLVMFLVNINASCQTLPLGTTSFDAPNGAYIKDMNNEYSFWEGTWEGTIDNKKYTLIITKFTHHLTTYPSGKYFYEDLVAAKLKVTDLSTNQVIYDESSFSEYDDYIIKCLVIFNNKFICGLYDDENYCYNNTKFILEKNPNVRNQITYKDFKYSEYQYWDCPYANQEDIPMFLPKVDLVLIRQ